jgi:hypothetical protein
MASHPFGGHFGANGMLTKPAKGLSWRALRSCTGCGGRPKRRPFYAPGIALIHCSDLRRAE